MMQHLEEDPVFIQVIDKMSSAHSQDNLQAFSFVSLFRALGVPQEVWKKFCETYNGCDVKKAVQTLEAITADDDGAARTNTEAEAEEARKKAKAEAEAARKKAEAEAEAARTKAEAEAARKKAEAEAEAEAEEAEAEEAARKKAEAVAEAARKKAAEDEASNRSTQQ
jgi:hypothetical protein